MIPSVKKHIGEMSTYRPPLEGRRDKPYLLLDFNERVVPLPEPLIESLVADIRQNRLHIYPEYKDIDSQIAKYAGVKAEQVMIANGSDQAIDVIFRAFTEMGDEVILPAPTFAMHGHCAQLQGCRIIAPLYRRESGYPLAEVLAAITKNTKIIVVCNPNSPTGTLLDLDGIAQIAAAAPGAAVLVDECYYEYSGVTAKDLLQKHPNIVITRTFSKTWGLASLRLGYLVAVPELVQQFLKVRGPYDINILAVQALIAAFAHQPEMTAYIDEVMRVSVPRLCEFLDSKGIPFWPTRANFVLLHPPHALAMEAALRADLILTRPRQGPQIENTLRITLGTAEQTDKLIRSLKKFLDISAS